MSTIPDALPITVVILADEITVSLKRCVKSVEWAAEILILDSKHHLTTSQITGWHPNLLILPIDPLVDFAKARNRGLDQATNEWVLFVDSDEWLECTATEMSAQLQSLTINNVVAARLHRIDLFYDKMLHWGEVKNQWPIRLMRRDAATFHGTVHEIAEVKGAVSNLTPILFHQPHLSINAFMQSVDDYSQRAAQAKTTPFSRLELILWPIGKWLMNVFIKLAWLDGWRGIVYATIMSWHSWLVRCYWYARTTS